MAAVLALFEVWSRFHRNLFFNAFQPAQFLFDLRNKATRFGPSLKMIRNLKRCWLLWNPSCHSWLHWLVVGILIKLIRLPPADKSSKTLDLATFSNGFRVGQSGMMSAKLPLLDPDPRVSISRIAFSKIFVWAKLPLRDPAPKKRFSDKPSVSNSLAFAKLPRRIVICRFSKMFGFCTFSTAGGIVKVGSERLTFLLAGSWIMFRNEMNISLDLHIAQQLHLSTMYNKYGINLKICTTLSIGTIC